ncbi:hypothetical protein KM043_012102 [Ampulex compressa]|nr:hypothetical protein KM043_012102 [Ampulex compressa]
MPSRKAARESAKESLARKTRRFGDLSAEQRGSDDKCAREAARWRYRICVRAYVRLLVHGYATRSGYSNICQQRRTGGLRLSYEAKQGHGGSGDNIHSRRDRVISDDGSHAPCHEGKVMASFQGRTFEAARSTRQHQLQPWKMVSSVQRRSHGRTSFLLLLLLVLLLGFPSRSESTPTSKSSGNFRMPSLPSLSSESSQAVRRSQEIGTPSELAWQAWLLVDTQTGAQSSLDSASLLRRITPKSIFVAPLLQACAEGYEQDAMGRCVKNFNLDEKAHMDFVLKRLNVKYENHRDGLKISAGSSGAGKDQKQSNGPLQVSIPLFSDSKSTNRQETRDTMEVPVALPTRGAAHQSQRRKPQEAVVTVYEVRNDTSLAQEETMSFLGNSSSKEEKADQAKPDAVVPVAEFVDEANETDFSGVVDYKIAIDLNTLLNASSAKLNVSYDKGQAENATLSLNATEVPPTLVLLLPSKLPHVAPELGDEDPRVAQNSTAGRVIFQMTNLTGNFSGKEIISVSVPESMIPPLKKLSEVPLLVVDRADDNETRVDGASSGESQEVESMYDDEEGEEEYENSTDMPDEESLELEGGEILRHGEAGMTIPLKNLERLHANKAHRESAHRNATSRNETSRYEDQIYIRFNESTPADKDEAGSNVSSEVSINDDFILETTLLDVNTHTSRNTTKSGDKNRSSTIEEDEDDFGKLLDSEKLPDTEPEVIFSSQDVRGTMSTGLHGRKRVGQPIKTETLPEDLRSDELEAAPSSSESLLYDPHPRDESPEEETITEIHRINERPFSNRARPHPEDPKGPIPGRHSESSFPSFSSATPNFRPAQEFVKFPSRVRQPVRFPSEEVNSIHNQDYKDRASYPLDESPHSSTKSSIPGHQKQSYWWVSPGWRSDRQQVEQEVESSSSGQRQKQRPMLLRFWTRMPLLRDPGFYPTDRSPQGETVGGQHGFSNERVSQRASSTRRVSYYKEMSAQDVNRVLKSTRAPLGG